MDRNASKWRRSRPGRRVFCLTLGLLLTAAAGSLAGETETPRAFIDGVGDDWRTMTLADFDNVNTDPDTWSEADGVISCTGQPIGVARSKETFTNLELVIEWRHLKPAGNSGVFLWSPPEAFVDLKRGKLPPGGIEVQVLDPEYETQYEAKTGNSSKGIFTGHGDVFSVGTSTMKAFPPAAAHGTRSFPTKSLVKPAGEWNHYYVRAVNGEVRLWVNGEEVSGGSDCEPSTGYLCLESEGSPVEFRNFRIRVLP